MNRTVAAAAVPQVVLAVVLAVLAGAPVAAQEAVTRPAREQYLQLAQQVETHLHRELDLWFPRCVDAKQGGFTQTWHRDWSAAAPELQRRSLVMQARHTWTAASAVHWRADAHAAYKGYALHGLQYLEQHLWDQEYGGFYWELNLNGDPSGQYGELKHLYGQAFAIYSLAAVHQATEDSRALQLAQRTFRWIDTHAHDAVNGGYVECLTRQGDPVRGETRDPIGTLYGFKSMNTHIHLLEAFTALYRQWPDPGLRQRLDELLQIVRDRMWVEPGALSLYYTADWRAVPDADSFGHDVETAYLLLDAVDVLGLPDDSRTQQVARSLVDHALRYGWDRQHGGFFDEGTAFRGVTKRHKNWWVQAEGLHALMLAHTRWDGEGAYWRAFMTQLEFIETHQMDAMHGGWYQQLSPSGEVVIETKGSSWKGAYHTTRSLAHVARHLRQLAARQE